MSVYYKKYKDLNVKITEEGRVYFKDNLDWHREDGPALELTGGNCYWYYEGKLVNVSTQKEFESFLKLKAFI